MRRALGWATHVVATVTASPRRRLVRVVVVVVVLATVTVGLASYGWVTRSWRQAQADFDGGRFDEARRRLDSSRFLWGEDPAYLLLSARVHRAAGELAAAEADLDHYFTVSRGSRDDAQIEFLLLRAQAGDDEADAPLLNLVEQGHPQSPAILETLSSSYMRRLRYLAANATLTKWIELSPEAATPYEWRGWVYERTSNSSLAYQDYSKALELDPNLLLVRLRLVELLLELKKVPEVTPHLEVLARQAPARVEVKARLGMLRFLEGRSNEARALLEAAEPKLAPNDVAPLVTLARLDVQEGRGADAERRLRKVIALDPTESDARFVLVAALRLQGKEQEALTGEREQVDIRDRNERVNVLLRDRADKADATPDEWFEIGNLFLGMKMESRGVYWLEKALAKNPNHQAAHRVLAEYSERKGDAAAAAAHRRLLR